MDRSSVEICQDVTEMFRRMGRPSHQDRGSLRDTELSAEDSQTREQTSLQTDMALLTIGIAAVNSLKQGLNVVSDAKKQAELLADIVPEDWYQTEVLDVQGFTKIQFASLAVGVAVSAHSCWLLWKASNRLSTLDKLEKETKGLAEEVSVLQREYADVKNKVTDRFEKIYTLLSELKAHPEYCTRISTIASLNQKDTMNFENKVSQLLGKVAEKIKEVQATHDNAVQSVASASLNIAAAAIAAAVAFFAPGGALLRAVGMAANAAGGAVATSVLVFEVVNLVNCTEILTELHEVEKQLLQMNLDIAKLSERAQAITEQMAKYLGDEDLL